MPAMYAHDTFGPKAAAELPASVKKPILQYPYMFRAGLQGPDILFFYNPFTEHPVGNIGRRLHKKTARSFFENAREIWRAKGQRPSQTAYLMGFLCHFMLDSACHPYIRQQMEETGMGHVAIETEFERFLLLLDGKDPLSFPVGCCMPLEKGMACDIAPFYPGVSSGELEKSLRAMRRYKNLLVMPNAAVRKLAKRGLRLVGQYNAINQHIIDSEPNPRCRMVCEHLFERYRRTIPQAAGEMRKLEKALAFGGPFSERLNRTFE